MQTGALARKSEPYHGVASPRSTAAYSNVDYRACLIRNLPLVKDVVRAVSRRARISWDEEAELLSATLFKLVDDNYAVLRRFRGESGLRTFVFAVVRRLLLDARNSAWGKWRPSSKARRLGPAAVLLEELTVRDGLTSQEALAVVVNDPRLGLSACEVNRLSEQLPSRSRRAHLPLESAAASALPASQAADAGIEEVELVRQAARLQMMLAFALGSLAPEERRMLSMRFKRSCSIADIARSTGADQKALYRTFARVLARLRWQLERGSLSKPEVGRLVGHSAVSIDSVLD